MGWGRKQERKEWGQRKKGRHDRYDYNKSLSQTIGKVRPEWVKPDTINKTTMRTSSCCYSVSCIRCNSCRTMTSVALAPSPLHRAHPDLSQGPADLQSAALATELCTQMHTAVFSVLNNTAINRPLNERSFFVEVDAHRGIYKHLDITFIKLGHTEKIGSFMHSFLPSPLLLLPFFSVFFPRSFFGRAFIHLFSHVFLLFFIRSIIHLFVRSLTHSFIRSFFQSPIYFLLLFPACIRSMIHPSIYSCIHAFTLPFVCGRALMPPLLQACNPSRIHFPMLRRAKNFAQGRPEISLTNFFWQAICKIHSRT